MKGKCSQILRSFAMALGWIEEPQPDLKDMDRAWHTTTVAKNLQYGAPLVQIGTLTKLMRDYDREEGIPEAYLRDPARAGTFADSFCAHIERTYGISYSQMEYITQAMAKIAEERANPPEPVVWQWQRQPKQ